MATATLSHLTPESQEWLAAFLDAQPEPEAPSPEEENTYTVFLPVSTPDQIPDLKTFPKEPGKEAFKQGSGIFERDIAISDLGEFYASWWLSPRTERDWLPEKQHRCNLDLHLKGAAFHLLSRCLLLTDQGKRTLWDSITRLRRGYCHDTISTAFDDLDAQHFTELVASYQDPDRRKENKANERVVRSHATWAELYPGACHLIRTYGLRRGQEQRYFWAGFNYVLWLNHRFIISPDGKRTLNPESHPTEEEIEEMIAGTLVLSANGRLVRPKEKTA